MQTLTENVKILARLEKESNRPEDCDRVLWDWYRGRRYYAISVSMLLTNWVVGLSWELDPGLTWALTASVGPWHLNLHRETIQVRGLRAVGDEKWKSVEDSAFAERPKMPRPSERVKLSWWRKVLGGR